MSGYVILFEVILVFGGVFAFGFWELRKLKQYEQNKDKDEANGSSS